MARHYLNFFLYLTLLISYANGEKDKVKSKNNKYTVKTKNRGNELSSSGPVKKTKLTLISAYAGDYIKLQCESSKPMTSCKFKSPNGEILNIGVRGKIVKNKKRVGCLCMEENYDRRRVCAIFIRDLTKWDRGAWRCQMKHNHEGKKKTKTKTKTIIVSVRDKDKTTKDGHIQCRKNYTTLTDYWRRIVPGVSHPSSHCDSEISNFKPGWYRFSFPQAPFAKIPTTPPLLENRQNDRKSCGTNAVPWMDATYPKVGEKPKDVIIKFAFFSSENYENVSAKVVACPEQDKTVYIYHLPAVPYHSCSLAYCAM